MLSLDAQIYTLSHMAINFPDYTVANILKQSCQILRRKDSTKYIINPKNIFVLDGYKIKFFNLVQEWQPQYLAPEVRRTGLVTQKSQIYALAVVLSEILVSLDSRGQIPIRMPTFLEKTIL